MKTCSVEGCDQKRKGHGYCPKHLHRVKTHGDPHKVGKRPPTVFPGERYGRLTVVEDAAPRKGRHDRCYLCQCDCGRTTSVPGYALRNGNTRSCGCLRIERVVETKATHGLFIGGKDLRPGCTYYTWAGLKGRCTNPKHKYYRYYGGRGIAVTPRWLGRDGYVNFVADMGERPAGTTLDRIDVNGNYEPGNCRWATAAEQAQNKQADALIDDLQRVVDQQAEIIEELRQELGI